MILEPRAAGGMRRQRGQNNKIKTKKQAEGQKITQDGWDPQGWLRNVLMGGARAAEQVSRSWGLA